MSSGFLSRLQKGAVLCDGAMGTLLYAKGIFINRCYDELNLSAPDLIRGIHQDYLKAGAEVIETNTFRRQFVSPGQARMCGQTGGDQPPGRAAGA